MAANNIGQWIKDQVSLLKSSRKHQVIVGAVVGLFVLGMLIDSGEPRRGRERRAKPVQEKPIELGSGANEAYIDLMNSLSSRLDGQDEKMGAIQEQLKVTTERMTDQEEQSAKIFEEIIRRIGTIQNSTILPPQQQILADPGMQMDPLASQYSVEPVPTGLETFGNLDTHEIAPPPVEEPERVAVIGVGDSVRVKLIAGVNAPTDGTPYPTLFKMLGPVTGPDGSTLPLGEGRILAAAQGSLSDTRALFRLRSLSLRLPDGSRADYSIDGWIVGEDGLRGMEGQLIDPFGKVLKGSGIAGFVQGAGEGIKASSSTQYVTGDGLTGSAVDGDLWEYAVGAGLGKAGQRWYQLIESRLQQYVPHVRILSGRDATAIFGKQLTISGLYEQLAEEEAVYGALD